MATVRAGRSTRRADRPLHDHARPAVRRRRRDHQRQHGDCRAELTPIVRLKAGDPFVQATLDAAVAGIRGLYRARGFTQRDGDADGRGAACRRSAVAGRRSARAGHDRRHRGTAHARRRRRSVGQHGADRRAVPRARWRPCRASRTRRSTSRPIAIASISSTATAATRASSSIRA